MALEAGVEDNWRRQGVPKMYMSASEGEGRGFASSGFGQKWKRGPVSDQKPPRLLDNDTTTCYWRALVVLK